MWTWIVAFVGLLLAAPALALAGTDHVVQCTTFNTGRCSTTSPGFSVPPTNLLGKVLVAGAFVGTATITPTNSLGEIGIKSCTGVIVGVAPATPMSDLINECTLVGFPIHADVPFTLECVTEGVGIVNCSASSL
jgi:hypothetical protein